MSIQLPTEKTPPALTAQHAKVLLYGPPKIGKTTLAAGIDSEHTLFLACEPGLGAQEVFQQPVTTWETFRLVGAELAKQKRDGSLQFTTIVIDTVDELAKMCTEDVLGRLEITHPGDLGYGKGWAAVSDEWRLRIGKLAGLGLGVWFISHSRERDHDTRVGTITKIEPTVTGQIRTFLEGFCDFIFFATSRLGENGESRVVHTHAAENYEAGSRVPLPDPLPLDANAVRDAMAQACQSLTSTVVAAAIQNATSEPQTETEKAA